MLSHHPPECDRLTAADSVLYRRSTGLGMVTIIGAGRDGLSNRWARRMLEVEQLKSQVEAERPPNRGAQQGPDHPGTRLTRPRTVRVGPDKS
jgi:hypothetical protein